MVRLSHGAGSYLSILYGFPQGSLVRLAGKGAHEPRRPTWPELIPVSVAWSSWEYCYSPLDGMIDHRRVTPQQYVAGYPFIHLGGERQCRAMFLVSYLKKQQDGRDWASNYRSSDLKSNALTTIPTPPPHPPGNRGSLVPSNNKERDNLRTIFFL